MNNPLVSVIIPACNAERFMTDTLNSVFDQNYRPIEVIVVDDGSTDRTAEIVQGYQTKNSNTINLIYICQQKNAGPSRARNIGIKESKGKYIAFLDSDDLWPREKLSKQVGLMEAHPDTGLLFGDVQRFSENGPPRPSMFTEKGLGLNFFGGAFYVDRPFERLFECNYIPTGTVILKRECHDKIGIFDERFRYVEDMELWFRMTLHFKIGYSRDIWEFKRDHETNISKDNEVMELSFIKVLEKLQSESSEQLAAHKINLRISYSNVYQRLGFICFKKSAIMKARRYFWKSFILMPRFRTIAYLIATFTGHSLSQRILGNKSPHA